MLDQCPISLVRQGSACSVPGVQFSVATPKKVLGSEVSFCVAGENSFPPLVEVKLRSTVM